MPYSAASEDNTASRTGRTASISRTEFEWIRNVARAAAGIHLAPERAAIVSVRISRRVRATGAADISDYIERLKRDTAGTELSAMIDALTVNRTCFFREPDHFSSYLAILRELLERQPRVSVWSAGCATGEEPYTLAMLALTLAPDAARRVRVLATDISARALRVARTAVYSADNAVQLPPALRALLEPAADDNTRVRVSNRVREMVSFARHNLVGTWQMRGPFHVIFCRNVLIYFDVATQQRVTDGFYQLLAPDGHLFVGHTEAVPADSLYQYVQPAAYRKPSSS